MMRPWEQLAQALEPVEGEPEANIYPAFAEGDLVAPAIVLAPDDPWMEPHAYGYDQERYVAVAAVKASAGSLSGVEDLYQLVRHILRRASSIEGVAYEDVSAPVIDTTTGTPFLAVRVRLTYRNCDEEES